LRFGFAFSIGLESAGQSDKAVVHNLTKWIDNKLIDVGLGE